jgi:hypothetical protein
MMCQIARTASHNPVIARPPLVPLTVVRADPSFTVRDVLARELTASGWDIRIKQGGAHDLHVQDPQGLADLLDDILAA